MKFISLTKNKIAIVDDEDFEKLYHFKWCSDRTSNLWYAHRRIGGRKNSKKIYMHRFILNFPVGEIDHINGNGLDNRKENLRICSHKENIRNQKIRTDNTSGYKGVRFKSDYKRNKPWEAYITVNGKRKSLGLFSTAFAAHKIYDFYAKKYFGEFIRLNIL